MKKIIYLGRKETEATFSREYRNVPRHCSECHEDYVLVVDADDFNGWQDRTHIQNAFPYLTANEREMIKTGMHGTCWDAVFAPFNREDAK